MKTIAFGDDKHKKLGRKSQVFSKQEDYTPPHEKLRAQFCAPH